MSDSRFHSPISAERNIFSAKARSLSQLLDLPGDADQLFDFSAFVAGRLSPSVSVGIDIDLANNCASVRVPEKSPARGKGMLDRGAN